MCGATSAVSCVRCCPSAAAERPGQARSGGASEPAHAADWQVGAEVAGIGVGDEVYGFIPFANPTVRDGSWAELITVAVGSVARAPARVDLAT